MSAKINGDKHGQTEQNNRADCNCKIKELICVEKQPKHIPYTFKARYKDK